MARALGGGILDIRRLAVEDFGDFLEIGKESERY
jgi:hypothetical protein